MTNITRNMNGRPLEYMKATTEEVRKICQPFLDKVGLTYFCYHRVLENGKHLAVVNQLRWAEFFLENFKDDDEIANLFSKSKFLPYMTWCAVDDNRLFSALREHNIWNGFTRTFICKDDSVESFSFATNINRTSINKFYVSNISLIEKFIAFFREKARQIISPSDRKKTYFSKAKIYETSKKDFIIPGELFPDADLSKTYINRNGVIISLSKREIECLQYLSKGETAKGVARKLELSPRTIEFYIRNIKEKTGYNRRSDLISLLQNNPLEL
ncbi:MAG: helix-turn-helix transcriptional regulator [Alphaproteobacteria bacterium]|nr:helix-turn-helix transcriptional regulator [Alphaproteobacteria bacterium]